MNLVIGGGVGEHGRNCFYVEADINYIVDCGIMKGAEDCYPHLNAEQISDAKYLLLTHSHEDHIGAFGWLLKQGFDGTIIASAKTLESLPFYSKVCALPEGGEKVTLENITIEYGRSGHCVGSLWYLVTTVNSKVLFSGDYCENSAFKVDKIRGKSAPLAVLDSAFGNMDYNCAKQGQLILAYASVVLKKGPLLLPVPKNGRAIDLVYLLRSSGKIAVDEGLIVFFDELSKSDYWVSSEITSALEGKLCQKSPNVFLIADAQLATSESKKVAADILKRGGSILFTGHADEGSEARRLVASGAGRLIPYNAHMCRLEADFVASENNFGKIIYFHGEE